MGQLDDLVPLFLLKELLIALLLLIESLRLFDLSNEPGLSLGICLANIGKLHDIEIPQDELRHEFQAFDDRLGAIHTRFLESLLEGRVPLGARFDVFLQTGKKHLGLLSAKVRETVGASQRIDLNDDRKTIDLILFLQGEQVRVRVLGILGKFQHMGHEVLLGSFFELSIRQGLLLNLLGNRIPAQEH